MGPKYDDSYGSSSQIYRQRSPPPTREWQKEEQKLDDSRKKQ